MESLNEANLSLQRTLRRQVPPEITWTAGGRAGPCGDGTAAGEQRCTAVPAPGASLTADEVMAHVEGQVAPYKRIRRVEFIEAVPKAASGKILRRRLRERARP